ncbi:hypothetical protein AMK59_6541 [Oryctes borbonicus]|uniref:O-acyltransferase WSD1 C-terminal domain-containing protein n=1 Tax=Oryctes borbonicus TaxID=1629725 RepID=A0A0T6AVU5_9SCAR|nr:hypothetical protein AMK59_6541 [Oryctes borbonicus]
MPEIRKLFIIIYAIVKDLLPIEASNKSIYHKFSTKLLTICISIAILSIIFAILVPFALLRLSIRMFLKIFHGKSYGGLLSGLDTLFEMYPNKKVINVINIYASKDEPEITVEKLRNVIYQIYRSSFKFSSHIGQCLGYCYFVKDQVNFEDVIEVTRLNNDEYITRRMLFDYLEENCFTLKRNQMWKVVIFSQPISWSRDSKDEYKQYVIIWTLRHSLGDGPSIITIFQKHAVQDDPQIDLNDLERLRRIEKPKISLDNVALRRNPATTKLDGLALKIHGNSKWHIASFIETEPKYVGMIKKIKQELNVSFTEVVSAAIIASVHDYVKQRNVTLNNFSLAKVIRLKVEDLIKLKNGTYKFEEIKNNFGLIALDLPHNLEERTMKSLIQYLQQYNESLRYAVDPLVAYTILDSICTYLPVKLTRFSSNSFMDSMTMGVTNLVGFQKSSLCGNVVDDVFFFAPGILNTGFTFSIFSYDGRLQIILTSREGFVMDREELQQVLDNVFLHIGRARKEIMLEN